MGNETLMFGAFLWGITHGLIIAYAMVRICSQITK